VTVPDAVHIQLNLLKMSVIMLEKIFVHFVGNCLKVNLLKPNDIYIYMSYRRSNLQTLHFKYLFNKYTY